MSTDAAWLQSALPVKELEMIREESRGHVRRRGDPAGGHVGNEIVEVSLVGREGGGGQPGLDPKPAEDLTNRLIEIGHDHGVGP